MSDDIEQRLAGFLGDGAETLATTIAILAAETMCDVTMARDEHGVRSVTVRTQRSRVVPAGNGGRRKPRRVLLHLSEVATAAGGPSAVYRVRGPAR